MPLKKKKKVTKKGKKRKNTESTASILKNKMPVIIDRWFKRSIVEIEDAIGNKKLALKNYLPEMLQQLIKEVSHQAKEESLKTVKRHSISLNKAHGKDRAVNSQYTIRQLILEYHILRQCIFEVIEEYKYVTNRDREIIVASIEESVMDATTQYAKSIKELQDKITSTLAHDLRTPLAVAKLNAQLLLRKQTHSAEAQEKLKMICKSMARVDDMVIDILDLSRIAASRNLVLAKFDLVVVIKDICSDLNHLYEDKIVFTTALTECYGRWNESGLIRILENLINNAFKHGKKNTPVTVILSEDAKHAIISVHNEGEALLKKEIDKMFKIFKRGKKAEQTKGWGIGLSVIKDLVLKHKGTISVKSEPRSGVEFIVKLPK